MKGPEPSSGQTKAMVMEKCGVRAPKSVRLLTCMALVSKNPLLNHLLWNPSSILLKLFLTLVSIQEESKALTIKEKLKRKMQQQLKKTFKVSGMDLLQNQPLFNIDFIHRRIRRLRRSA